MNPQLFDYLIDKSKQNWLIDINQEEFLALTISKISKLKQLQNSKNYALKILLSETNYDNFIASFLAAVITNNQIFLANPAWQRSEWQQVFDVVQPDLIWGESVPRIATNSKFSPNYSQALIMIPTGGTSGKIRFAIHTWSTLTASVQGFCNHFQTQTINSCCLLPLYHVSGLMQLMRSFLTEGKLLVFPYQLLKQNNKPQLNPQDFFISLVPTQLQFLLQSDPHWLAQFKIVLLGGAPATKTLLDAARKYRISVANTYGMTETASQIATLKPNHFLAGNDSNGRVLPHAKVRIISNSLKQSNFLVDGEKFNLRSSHEVNIKKQLDEQLSREQAGKIAIQANSLFLGYYPQLNPQQIFITDDLGFIDEQGYLHIIGRNSQKIITGGEKVFSTEVEAAILATELVKDVCVIGLPDHHWGQVVTAVYVPATSDVSLIKIQQKLQAQLSRYKHPKYWLKVDSLPRNGQGKINYQQIKCLALELLKSKYSVN